MPRPGPRPYECVKRAWHSDMHQPIRGSIIQQIFRLAKDGHKPATKTNKEWQEKLPTVVFKAEEIMYSKANSEAEYVNLDTLWERVNDAVNTIIRRDASSETGELLPPCVEAALHLGCVPVRASRSQRHSNPRCYLNPKGTGPASPSSPAHPPRIWDRASNEQCPRLSPLHLSKHPVFMRPTTAVNMSTSISEPYCPFGNNKLYASDSHPGHNPFVAMETGSSPNIGSHSQTEMSPLTPLSLKRESSNYVHVAKSVGSLALEPDRMGLVPNNFSFNAVRQPKFGSKSVIQEDVSDPDNPLEKQCDLSLRLGLLPSPQPRTSIEILEATLSSSHSRGKYCIASKESENQLCFFPTNVTNDPLGLGSSKRLRMCENNHKAVTVQQPSATFGTNVEERFFRQPDYYSNQFSGHMKRPGF